MELLAYTHAAATYEDSVPVEWRSPHELLSTIPSSAWLGVVSVVAFAAVVGNVEAAQAALCQSGDRGNAVSELQQALQTKGHYEAQIDGVFGSLTDTGVRQFQQSAQLVVDGQAGDRTLNALGLGDAIGTVFGTGATCNAGGGGGGGGSPQAGVVRIATQSNPLIVRSQPTTSSSDIDAIPNGTDVQFSDVSTSAAGTWLYAKSYGGWISARYTTYGAGSGGGTPETERGRVRIATQSQPLNVRSEASLSSPVLTAIAKDTLVNYSRVSPSGEGTWLYLPAYGGWVTSKYTTYVAGGGGGAPVEGTERSGNVEVTTRYNPLIVRSQPTTTSQPINALAKGTQTPYSRVASNDAGETWLYVPQYNGWISARYTSYGSSSGSSAPSTSGASATVTPPASTGAEAETNTTTVTPAPSPTPAATPQTPTGDSTEQTSPSPVAPSPTPAASIAPSPEAVTPVEPTASPTIAEEVEFEVAELARVVPDQAQLFSTPGIKVDAIATVEKGTFISFTKQARLSNGESWYFAPSFNGWIQDTGLEFISIDFAD